MIKATFRFYEELNDYLPENIQKKEFTYPERCLKPQKTGPTVKQH
jgi:hypothetical protein